MDTEVQYGWFNDLSVFVYTFNESRHDEICIRVTDNVGFKPVIINIAKASPFCIQKLGMLYQHSNEYQGC